MLKIHTTGMDDYLDGSANIKALIIGGPGAGKTRMSSYWPKPILLDCENGRGSLADRKVPYVDIKNSKDVLDSLEYLKSLESTPKGQRAYQTVVFDTADAFQRLVKDEWVQQTKAGSFTGYDAWGYLDTKMQMLFTRLLNLDYNVLVNVHFKDKTFKDGENTVREFMLQLQGAMSDQIFNDFGLVGFLGTYWDKDGEGRVQKRGLTFEPTPQKPFLKDRFNVTPKWMPIEFADTDYTQLFEAFFNRPEFEAMPESAVIGEIPDHERVKPAGVTTPAEGGPLPEKAPVEVPLEKKLKSELDEIARSLGIIVRGNSLKAEVIHAIRAQGERVVAEIEHGPSPAAPGSSTPIPDDTVNEVKTVGSPPDDGTAGGQTPAVPPTKSGAPAMDMPDLGYVETGEPEAQAKAPFDGRTDTEKMLGIDAPPPKLSSSEPSVSPAADAQPASPESSSPTATSSGVDTEQDPPMSFAHVAENLGATVISHEEHDTPTPQPASAPRPSAQGPSACADCGNDLAAEWADPTKKGYIRLSFVKFRRYLCNGCYAIAVNN